DRGWASFRRVADAFLSHGPRARTCGCTSGSIKVEERIMCILQPCALFLGWCAVAAAALAPQLAAAQTMARPVMPAAGSMSRPMMNPNTNFMGSMNGFRSPASGMMASPGMSAASSNATGSRGYSSGTGGYGGGTSGSSYGGQGGTYGTGNPEDGGDDRTRAETPSEDKSLGRVLTATGVPNDGGRLLWPVGLRALRGGATDEMGRQSGALLHREAVQAHTGPVTPSLARELADSIDVLRAVLRRDRERRFSLPLTLYEDAERFLARLDHAQKLLGGGPGVAGGKRPAGGGQGERGIGFHSISFHPRRE